MSTVWNGIFKPKNGEVENGSNHGYPWNSSIFEIARNHHSNNMNYGDMVRFQPNVYSHIARKIKVFPVPEAGRMETFPKFLVEGLETVLYEQELLRKV